MFVRRAIPSSGFLLATIVLMNQGVLQGSQSIRQGPVLDILGVRGRQWPVSLEAVE